MSIVYKNWFVHNMFAHPLSEIVYWMVRPLGRTRAKRAGDAIHDCTIPKGEVQPYSPPGAGPDESHWIEGKR